MPSDASAPTPGTPSLLRAINDRAALEALLAHGTLSRPELSRLTGISKPTASQLLARLEETGLVMRDGVREGTPGRTAELYRIVPSAAHVAGLDVTPRRIIAAVADLTGAVVGEHVLATPGRANVDPAARAAAAVDGAAAAAGLTRARLNRVVVGIPGAVNPATGRVGYAAHLPGWHVPGITAHLTAGLGVPVEIENDVNLGALAEMASGQAADVRDFALLWVGDGIGMAVVLDGRPHRGATGGAGEIGYMPAVGAPLVRGARLAHTGGVQTRIGSGAVLALLRRHGFHGRDVRTAITRATQALESAPRTRTSGAQGAAGGRREAAEAALGELAERLAATLANVVGILDPELIVLTGEVPRAGGEALRALVEQELHSLTIPRPPVRLSAVAGNVVLAGALDQALRGCREEVFSSTRAATT
ncbi:ROK family transcriptional regulator [Actinomadura oligospora]|uniref:ROK family transcriptional regulator n=1 Tax=Actinomadura oligospora TaxID=111804 RepID=UPI00047D26A7|nr:ROK family transcriptional regulator [Actinomadura oligospora]